MKSILVGTTMTSPTRTESKANLTVCLISWTAWGFPRIACAWKQLDLFTLLVEVHDAIVLRGMAVNPERFSRKLSDVYATVNATKKAGGVPPAGHAKKLIARRLKYLAAATQAANDKSQRVARGEVVSELLAEAVATQSEPAAGGRHG